MLTPAPALPLLSCAAACSSTFAALVAAALLVWAVEPLRVALGHVVHGDVDALQARLRDLGVTGALVVVALILAARGVVLPG